MSEISCNFASPKARRSSVCTRKKKEHVYASRTDVSITSFFITNHLLTTYIFTHIHEFNGSYSTSMAHSYPQPRRMFKFFTKSSLSVTMK